MIYLVLAAETEGLAAQFDSGLSATGLQRADALAQVLESLGIKWMFVCPARRCLQTILPFRAQRIAKVGYIRTTVSNALYPPVQRVEDAARPLYRDYQTLEEMKLDRSEIDGDVPRAGETVTELGHRILRWFRYVWWPLYQDSPVNCAIVCDRAVASLLVHHMISRGCVAQANDVIATFTPGAVYEFGRDGLGIGFKRQVLF
jgi:broad specificity phosphatase PhoE